MTGQMGPMNMPGCGRGSRSGRDNSFTTQDTVPHHLLTARFCEAKAIRLLWLAICWAAIFLFAGCGAGNAPKFETDVDVTPAEDSIGERLFLDPRFAQYFAAHMTDVNQPLAVGDPIVEQVYTTNGTLPGPFAGQSMNCRSCHFVTEFQGVAGAGNRTYSDYTTHSPIPRAMNGFTLTPRNAMHM